jgi:cytochrome bd ubiquinol oxidase subunit II
VPKAVTFWQAASPQSSVNFLLIGVGSCIPIVLAYNTYAYYVFRGKFTPFYAYRMSETRRRTAALRDEIAQVEQERIEPI